jgi:hypothetical protein
MAVAQMWESLGYFDKMRACREGLLIFLAGLAMLGV